MEMGIAVAVVTMVGMLGLLVAGVRMEPEPSDPELTAKAQECEARAEELKLAA